MARIHDVVFDCRHPASLARFWAAALDDYEVAPYDEAELARLRGIRINDPEDDPTVLVAAPGARPRLFFQLVPEPRTVKNRVHLDLRCDAVDPELPKPSGRKKSGKKSAGASPTKKTSAKRSSTA